VPPLEHLWIEFQGKVNALRANAWAVFFRPERLPEGWVVDAELVVERRKGDAFGPACSFYFTLDERGRLTEPGQMETPSSVLEEFQEDFQQPLLSMFYPSLLAISFMHCKNVDTQPVDPPPRLSANHARKHGRPLTRYYVLDIEPMRRILDVEGEAQTKGLPHALHICRGHFKTYTEDAPLFGKYTGTYWWEAQARGKPEHGIVEKDYRIRLEDGPAESFDEDLGREYVEANEHPEIKPSASEHTGLDPDLGGRGLKAHNVTQNLLARAVRDAGYEPRRPKPDEPQFDLAWEAGDVTWVAEVKSLTQKNEEQQLQKAVGQVLRYCQLLEAEQGRNVRPMIATEVKPSRPLWDELCAREGIVLRWGPENLAA
jgi:hypothetical protein